MKNKKHSKGTRDIDAYDHNLKHYSGDDINHYTGESVSDLVPDKIPDKVENDYLKADADYISDMYSDDQLDLHSDTDKNVYTVDGIPSRWYHNKLRSSYEFESFGTPDPIARNIQITNRFTNDMSDIINYAYDSDKTHLQTIGNYRSRNHSRQDHDLHDGEMMDIQRGTLGRGHDIDCMMKTNVVKETRDENDKVIIKRYTDIPQLELVYAMFDWLEIDVHQSRIHTQLLGQTTPFHIDQQVRYARAGWRDIWTNAGADKNPLKLRRFLIMLQDWDYGHVWQFGNSYYQGYRSGSAVTYDWCNMPHGAANFGYTPRVTLQVTGFISDKTQWLIDHPDSNREVEL